jgi:hypothetical protein
VVTAPGDSPRIFRTRVQKIGPTQGITSTQILGRYTVPSDDSRIMPVMPDRADSRIEIYFPEPALKVALRAAARVRKVSMGEAVRQAAQAYIDATIAATSATAPGQGRPRNSDRPAHPAAEPREKVRAAG